MTYTSWAGVSSTARKTIFKTDDIWVELETLEDGSVYPFIHVQVYHWNPGVYRQLHAVLHIILMDYPMVYAAAHDSKLKKFAEMFGFQDSDYLVTTTDGLIRQVMFCTRDMIPDSLEEILECHKQR